MLVSHFCDFSDANLSNLMILAYQKLYAHAIARFNTFYNDLMI